MTKNMLLDFLQVCLKDEKNFEKFDKKIGTLDKVVTYLFKGEFYNNITEKLF